MRNLILAAVATTAFATPALAQTTGAPFTGLRIEGVAGYDALKDGHDTSDGFVYGGAVGYDVQLNNLVVGAASWVEAEAQVVNPSARRVEPTDESILRGRDLYLGARVGFPLNPTTMAYAKGGYTNARIDTRYTQGSTEVRDHTDLDGFRLGAGLEHQIGANTYIKGEYRYSNYGHADNSVGRYDIDVDRHQLVAGVGMRF